MEKYLAFYTSRPYWAGKKPDVSFISDQNYNTNAFYEIMSEEVFIEQNPHYTLKVCRDGLIMFNSKKINKMLKEALKNNQTTADIKLWAFCLNYLNAIYLLFESAVLQKKKISYFEISEITNQDAFSITFEKGKFKGNVIADLSLASTFQMDRWLSNFSVSDLARIEHSRSLNRRSFILDEETFQKINNDLKKIINEDKLIKTISVTTKSLSEYKIGNFSTSLILAWFIIETYLNQYWKDFLKHNNKKYAIGKRINRKRLENLTNGRDYTASVILNYLELAGILEFNLFKNIDKVRNYRNKIVHGDEDYECEPAHCQKALDIIVEFIKKETQVKLQLNTSYRIGGI